MMALSDADQQQIRAVIRQADELATARDVDGYLALTTPDMVLDGTQGSASGREAVRAAIVRIWAAEPPGTRHLTGDITLEAGAEGTARARSTLSLETGGSDDVLAVATISQTLRKTDGKWLIARRSVSNS
ncbi:YybH family protein [Herbiconiux liangxiaofengii]|uniref:YybH family protein n=1 Tax=Herbiconiux liangxiaofengii TaxID=3342795 RepID=UPI0035BA0B65